MGQLTRAVDPNQATVTYAYNQSGQLAGMTDKNGRVYGWSYDRNDRPVQMIYPDLRSETWSYDGVGNTVGHTDRNGNRWYYQYDQLNRLLSKNLGNHTDAQWVDYYYDSAGQLSTVLNQSASSDFTYDDSGLLLHEDQYPYWVAK
jgi:YD repeat-containing protein